ncbi:MAG: GNAT family N-acetyltransferase [Mediterranea sp.]|jgi:diamine N-acetyltransferase|nr:GNAT family N-acetyltransferase [Mediterranea sp.]
MKHTYLINERIYLRAVEPEDLAVLYEVENDVNLWDISNFTVPYSRYVLRQYIENSQCDVFADKQLRLMITRKEDNLVLGTIDITDFSPIHRRGELGLAIRRDCRGQNYGTDALVLLCDYAFDYLRMEQLYAHIAADNTPCVNLFYACGFANSGLLKNWIQVEGTFKDAIVFQKLSGW